MSIARLTVERFKKAIEGSSGIKSVICARMPCDHVTLARWLAEHKSLRRAYDDECDKMLGLAHSVVTGNIEVALDELQEDGHKGQVDSSDAKWYLSKKGKAHGFGDEPAVQVTQNVLTLAEFNRRAEDRLRQVAELDD